jgi:hypothetical protein
MKQPAPRDSIHGGIETDCSEESGNIFASRVVTANIDETEEGTDIHQVNVQERMCH